MSDAHENPKARRPAQLFTEAMAMMRRVLSDDAAYLAMLKHVEGWIIGERSWLQGVADAKASSQASPQTVSLPMRGE